jgi:DNA-binding response OmpR family regulator
MSGASILLIEDDLNVYHGIQRRLKAFHYETFYAPDAVASISQARQHHPDLILLDLGLPAGDGFVVMERLRQIPDLSRIPVIVLSGRDRTANEARALRSGAAAFLHKPVNGDVLMQTISQCLARTVPHAVRNTYSVGADAASEPAWSGEARGAEIFAFGS